MKAPPYFNLTEVESHMAIWAGLLFMLLALMAVSFAGQRLLASRGVGAGNAGAGNTAHPAATPRRPKAARSGTPLPTR